MQNPSDENTPSWLIPATTKVNVGENSRVSNEESNEPPAARSNPFQAPAAVRSNPFSPFKKDTADVKINM